VNDVVKVACVQAEPVAFDRTATIDKLEGLAAEAAGAGARLALFPETFIPVYPSNRWVRYLAGWGGPEAGVAREVFARLMQQSVTVPGPDSDRLAEIARANDLWLAVGVNELDGGTIYNSLLIYSPAGELALHHRKLMPTNHERLVWGLGDGRGLETIATDVGKVGGLICWENLMPLARFALYEAGVEVYLAPTADDSEDWHGRRALSFSAVASFSELLPTRPTCRSRMATSSWAPGAQQFLHRTVPTSPGRCGTRKAFCTPISIQSGSTSHDSVSIRPGTITGRTYSASSLLRADPQTEVPSRKTTKLALQQFEHRMPPFRS